MTLYFFSPEELCVTAMFSRWETKDGSPLSLAEAAALPDLKDDQAVDECVKSLLETGMLLLENDGRIIPSREADMFLRILQDPDQVIQVSRLGLAKMKDFFLCSYDNLWCIYGCTTDGLIHSINFPILKENLPEWFKADILTDYRPNFDPRTRMDVTLNTKENLLLLWIQNVYASRIVDGPLAGDDLWFTLAELVAHPDVQAAVMSLPLYCSAEQLEELESEFASSETWQAGLLQLVKKGLLEVNTGNDCMDRFSYSDMLKEWLNPGGLLDAVSIRQSIPENQSKTLYLKRNGCLMLEQTDAGVRYRTVKDSADYISLTYNILDF